MRQDAHLPYTNPKKVKRVILEGLIVPRPSQSLRPLWKAFREGKTWFRIGRKSGKRLRLRHSTYSGRVTLQWWGPAIRCQIEDFGNVNGRITGALLGHVHRHSKGAVDRLEAHLSA